MKKGFFLVFESAPKGGKTTLAGLLTAQLKSMVGSRLLISGRSALSKSDFAEFIKQKQINDIGYSTAFYWADIVFDTHDSIMPILQQEGIVIKDRYDLSIVTYREVKNFSHDYFLLREYIARGMIINPNLTIFLNPSPEVTLGRIKENPDSSLIDKEFLKYPDGISIIQARIEYYLKGLQRQYIVLDTGTINKQECIACIIKQMQLMGGI